MCGDLQVHVEASGPGTTTGYLLDESLTNQRIILYTQLDAEQDLNIKLMAQNDYTKQEVVSSLIQWRRCDNKTPIPGSHAGVDDGTSTTLIDFRNFYLGTPATVIGDVVTGDPWSFDSGLEYCYIDEYEFECTDPAGGQYVVDTRLGVTLNTSVACMKFITTQLSDRIITADVGSFLQTDEGIYTLAMSAYMKIDAALNKFSLKGRKQWKKKIQADCGDPVANEITAAVASLASSTVRSVAEPVGTGTRIAKPSSLPLSCGRTSEIAFAAPVELGMIFVAAARARRRSLCGKSRITWSFVYA